MMSQSAASDEELVRAWQSGHHEASQALLMRYHDRITRFFVNKVGGVGGQTEDLVQQTFLACLQAVPRYRSEAPFERFLLAIAYKVLCKHVDRLRRSHHPAHLEGGSFVDTDPSPSSIFSQRERGKLVITALRQLPIDLQTVLELYYWEGLRGPALAEIIKVPEGTVRTRLRRGRQLLLRNLRRMVLTRAQLDETSKDIDRYAEEVKHEVLRYVRR